MKKRVLSILLVAALLASLCFTSAFAAAYDDTDGHWGEEAIAHWSDYSVVQGDDTGSFNPDDCMTRAEAATVFVNLLQLSTTGDISAFTDVDADAWYADAVAKCCAAGIIKGTSATTAAPYDLITREQFMTMFARAVGMPSADALEREFTDAADVSDWASGFVNALVNAGYVNGVSDTELAPLANITRASVMQVLYNSITTYANEANTEVEAAETGITLVVADNVNVTGSAEMISVAGENNNATATAASIATVPGNNSNLIFTVTESDAALDVAAVDGSNSSIEFDVNDGASVTIAAVSVTGENSGVIGSTSDEDTSVAVSGTAEDVTVSASGSHKLAVTVSDATVGITSGNVSVDGTADAVATSGSDVTVTTGGATITVSTASGSTVTVEKTATVGTVEAGSSETKVVVNGTADEVLVTGDSANVTVSTSADVGTIEVTEGTTGATVTTTQTVTDNGTDTTVSGSTSSSGGGGGGGGSSHTHSYTLVEAKDATCTEAGNIAYYACSRNDSYLEAVYDEETGEYSQGDSITLASTVIDATGHTWDEGEVHDATCVEDGYILYTCTVCGETYTEATGETATGTHHTADSSLTECEDCGTAIELSMDNIEMYGYSLLNYVVFYTDGSVEAQFKSTDDISGSNARMALALVKDLFINIREGEADGTSVSILGETEDGDDYTLELEVIGLEDDTLYMKASDYEEMHTVITEVGMQTKSNESVVNIPIGTYITNEEGETLTFTVPVTNDNISDIISEANTVMEGGASNLSDYMDYSTDGETGGVVIYVPLGFELSCGDSVVSFHEYITGVTITINGGELTYSGWTALFDELEQSN